MLVPETFTTTFTGAGNLAIPAMLTDTGAEVRLIDVTIDARGTFNSGTVQLQRSLDGTNYVALGTGLTANGQEHLVDSTVGNGAAFRVNTGAATSIVVTVIARYGR